MIVYDKSGKEHSKDPVDAFECVSVLGWSLTKGKAAKNDQEKEIESIDAIKKELDGLGVDYSGISGIGNMSKLLARARIVKGQK